MAEQDQKAGTPGASETGDDAAKAALAESAETAGRDAESEGQDDGKRTDWKALALGYKGKAELANRLEEEITELKGKLAEQPSPTNDQQAQSENRELQELANDLAEAEQKYRETKDVAYKLAANSVRMLLAASQQRVQERRQEQAERADHDYLLTAIEVNEDGEELPLTPKRRKEVEAFHKRNKEHFASVAAAHDALLGREYRQSRTQLAKEKSRLAREAPERGEDVVRTHTRDVSAREAEGRKMTHTQYQTKIAQLEESDPAAAWKLKQDVAHNRVLLSG